MSVLTALVTRGRGAREFRKTPNGNYSRVGTCAGIAVAEFALWAVNLLEGFR